MLVANGPQWFDRGQPDPRWPSFVVSLVITALLFGAAFVAMRSVHDWIDARKPAHEAPVMVHLDPPSPAPPIPKPTHTQPAQAAPPPAAPIETPTSVAPPVVVPAVPVAVPVTVVERDTGARVAPAQGVPLGALAPSRGHLADTAMGLRGGAPIAPAGLTIGSRIANTALFRDSVANARIAAILPVDWMRAPTGREKAELDESRRVAVRMQERATSVGNQSGRVVLMGDGVGGAGAVGGGKPGMHVANGVIFYSVPFPLFSMGPSPEQRKRNEAIDADNRARFGRLDDRLLLKRDSVRADSLRRDSLAKARSRVVP